jgi:hypothetical protein
VSKDIESLNSLPEIRAKNILETYEGSNNYILNIKKKGLTNKNYVITRSQAEYIINYENVIPKVAKKWVEVDSYFSKKLMEEKLLPTEPKEIYVEKLLVGKILSYLG